MDVMRKALAILAPPPEMTISDWADAKRRLSSEASAEPGPWRTDRAAYQRARAMIRLRQTFDFIFAMK